MTTRVKLRRGTTLEMDAFTGAEAELTYDTEKKTLVVHDGNTQGGYEISRQDKTLALVIGMGW
jgi:hypothetical protein